MESRTSETKLEALRREQKEYDQLVRKLAADKKRRNKAAKNARRKNR